MTETFPNLGGARGLDTPASLLDLAADLRRHLGDHPAADIVEACLTNSWATSLRRTQDGEIFLSTGDIPAMWLRDSTSQVRPYLYVAGADTHVADVLAGLSMRQMQYVLLDPYANAFNEGPSAHRADEADLPIPGSWVWERKYEVDSLAAPLQLAYALWTATGRTDHLDDNFAAAARLIVNTWRLEQDHAQSSYSFRRTHGPFSADSLDRDGRGAAVGITGMTWSGFRPSDDRCRHGYLVPANALAAVSLHGLAELALRVLHDEELASDSRSLAQEIDAGIFHHAVVERAGAAVLAYEVNGLGEALIADDANLPSLLSLPYLGWCTDTDPLYLATRELILSPENPWYFSGRHARGVGSAHTASGHVWPIALAAAALTSPSQTDRDDALAVLAGTTGGTGLMHESFHVDDPTRYTREWFGWANALFSELAMELTGRRVTQLYPRHPRTLGTLDPHSSDRRESRYC